MERPLLRLDILHTFDVAEDDVGDIGIVVPTTVRGLIGEVFVEAEVIVCVGKLGLGALEGGGGGEDSMKQVRAEITHTSAEIVTLLQELTGLRNRVAEARIQLLEATAELKVLADKKGYVYFLSFYSFIPCEFFKIYLHHFIVLSRNL